MKFKTIFFTCSVCLIFFLCFSGMDFNQTQYDVFIPSIAEIGENGYPMNNKGETYGPYLGYGEEPDLIAAYGISKNGEKITGYVKKDDENEPTTLEQALAYRPSSSVNLYAQDGDTIIGTFKLTTQGGY